MANKKISELESRASLSLSDLMAVGDPSTGYLYKTTISDLKTLTGAGVVSFNGRFGTVNPAEGDYTLTQLGDVIITSPSNNQVLQYNGSNWVNAAYPAETDTLNSVTTRGNTTGNVITVGGITAGTTGSAAYHTFYSSTVNDGSTVTIAAENLSANASRSQIMISDLSGGAGKRFGIGVYTGASPYSYLDAATKLVLQQSGGNVIIGGIVDAGYKLDVVGGFRSALSAGHFVHLDPANYRYLVNISNTQTLQDSENITLTVNGSGYIAFQTALVNRFVVNNSGTITISSLAGTGSRMVVANSSGLLSTQAIPDLTGYVTLGTAQTITGEKIFTTGISAVGGIALRDTVGGSNYGGIIANSAFFQISAQGGSAILIKASDGTNALTIGTTGNTLMTNVTATSFIRSGGTSSQFLKADGSVDSNTYLTSASVSGVYLPLSGGTLTGGLILSPASGAASITMNAPTGQLNEIVFKVNSTNVGWMYVNASYFQFNSSTSGGYLFKNTAGTNILAMTDAGAATFSSTLRTDGVINWNGTVGALSYGSGFVTMETNSATQIRLVTNGTTALTIGTDQTATFSSSVGAKELYLSTANGLVGNINSSNANGGYLTWQTGGTVIADIGTTQQIFGSGGNGTFGINARGARSLAFGANNSEVMRITTNGLYIGNTAALGGEKFSAQIIDSRAISTVSAVARFMNNGVNFIPKLILTDNNTADATICLAGGVGSKRLSFGVQGGTSGHEYFNILENGNVGINTTSPSDRLQVVGSFRWAGATNNVVSSNDAGGVYMELNGTSTATRVLRIQGINDAGNRYSSIKLRAGEEVISFETADNERMRISSGGVLMVGTSTVLGGGGAEGVNGLNIGQSGVITSNSTSDFNAYFAKRSGYSFGGLVSFYVAGTQVGSISTNGTSTAYNTSSDYRLKQDLKDFSGLDLVSKIKAYDYEWKADKTRSHGVIAHELQAVINYAVTGQKDGKEMQGVDYSKIVPVLIKAIQELNEKIK